MQYIQEIAKNRQQITFLREKKYVSAAEKFIVIQELASVVQQNFANGSSFRFFISEHFLLRTYRIENIK